MRCSNLFNLARVPPVASGWLLRALPRPHAQPFNADVPVNRQAINREILLGLWKIHILHHAAEGGVVGNWMLRELRHHGYEVSPGTFCPSLARMERLGWLRGVQPAKPGGRRRRSLHITAEGRWALAFVMRQVGELHCALPSQPKPEA